MIEPISTSSSTPSDTQNDWLFTSVESWLKGRVLELESQLNSISSFFVQRSRPIHLSTPDESIKSALDSIYQSTNIVRKIHLINITEKDFEQKYPQDRFRIFDTILVLSSIATQSTIQNAKHLLRERGRLIFQSPVTTVMFNEFDINDDILEKYDRKSLRRIIGDLELLSVQHYVNSRSTVLAVVRKK